MNRLTAAGYFGCGNFGDDWLLDAFLYEVKSGLWQKEGLDSNSSWNLYPRARVFRSVNHADQAVLLGGLFQDLTSVSNTLYYGAALKWIEVFGARQVFLAGCSVGPLKSSISRRLLTWLARTPGVQKTFFVRDQASFDLLNDLGLGHLVQKRFDPCWAAPLPKFSREDLVDGVGIVLNGSLRLSSAVDDLVSLSKRILGQEPVKLLMADPKRDYWQAMEIARRLGQTPQLISYQGDQNKFMEQIFSCRALVSLRLHAAVAAQRLGVASVAFCFDRQSLEKMRTLLIPPAYSFKILNDSREISDWVFGLAAP